MSKEAKSPDIIYRQKYHQYFSESFKNTKEYRRMPEVYDTLIKKSQFYRDPGSHNSLTSYLTRNGACDKSPIGTDELNEEKELLKEIGASERSILNYLDQRKGSTGLFNEHGDITKKEMKELRMGLSQCQSNIYEGVLSFTDEYSNKIVTNKEEAYKLLKEIMPKYFSDKGLDPNNMTWFAAYHVNTKHRHCHIIFYEKEPRAYTHDGKPVNIKYTKADLNHFKELVAFARPMEHEYQFLRGPVMESLQEESKYSPFKEELDQVREVIKNRRQYNRCTTEEKAVIKNYMKFVYNHSENFKYNYDNMMAALNKKQQEIISNYKAMNLRPTEYAVNFAKNRKEELDDRVCNLIMKTAKESPLLNPTSQNKTKSYALQVRRDSSSIRITNLLNNTFNKAYKNNPDRLASIQAMSKEGQINVYCLIESYSKVINSERIWAELEADRQQAMLEAEKGSRGGEGR